MKFVAEAVNNLIELVMAEPGNSITLEVNSNSLKATIKEGMHTSLLDMGDELRDIGFDMADRWAVKNSYTNLGRNLHRLTLEVKIE